MRDKTKKDFVALLSVNECVLIKKTTLYKYHTSFCVYNPCDGAVFTDSNKNNFFISYKRQDIFTSDNELKENVFETIISLVIYYSYSYNNSKNVFLIPDSLCTESKKIHYNIKSLTEILLKNKTKYMSANILPIKYEGDSIHVGYGSKVRTKNVTEILRVVCEYKPLVITKQYSFLNKDELYFQMRIPEIIEPFWTQLMLASTFHEGVFRRFCTNKHVDLNTFIRSIMMFPDDIECDVVKNIKSLLSHINPRFITKNIYNNASYHVWIVPHALSVTTLLSVVDTKRYENEKQQYAKITNTAINNFIKKYPLIVTPLCVTGFHDLQKQYIREYVLQKQ